MLASLSKSINNTAIKQCKHMQGLTSSVGVTVRKSEVSLLCYNYLTLEGTKLKIE